MADLVPLTGYSHSTQLCKDMSGVRAYVIGSSLFRWGFRAIEAPIRATQTMASHCIRIITNGGLARRGKRDAIRSMQGLTRQGRMSY